MSYSLNQLRSKKEEKDEIISQFEDIRNKISKDEDIIILAKALTYYVEKTNNQVELQVIKDKQFAAEQSLSLLTEKFHSIGKKLVQIREECQVIEKDLREQGLIGY